MTKNTLTLLLATLLTTATTAFQAVADDEAWDKVQEKGVLEVALYEGLPPFSAKEGGKSVGIDVDIAKALAARLGVNAAIRIVGADENMEDDLRNNVWKGHYMGGGVADLMLHVPYDPSFARANDRVLLVAPYYREQVVLAMRNDLGSAEEPLQVFTHEKIGVELDTLADFFLLSTLAGQIRPNVVHFKNNEEATRALINGEIAGVMGPRGEIESGLKAHHDTFRVGPVQMPGMRQSGWDLGGAVRFNNTELGKHIDDAMRDLRSSGELEKIFAAHGVSYQLPSRVRMTSE